VVGGLFKWLISLSESNFMSSIAAVLNKDGAPSVAGVREMLAAAPHRGTDYAIETLGSCTIGVSLQDGRDDAGVAIDGSLAAGLAGSLDNLDDLRRLLGSSQDLSPEANPASLLIAGFRAFGEDLPNHLRGVFSLIITDGHRLWCCRDHLGFRTLFYRDEPRRLLVGSEAKQVLVGAGIAREPDPETIEGIFYGDLADERRCALKGVLRLPKATLLTETDGSVSIHRYWKPESLLETARLSDQEVADGFHELLAQAVTRAITGDDVVSLSGGIDSPPIAAFGNDAHRARGDKPISALTVLYPEQPSVDESRYVRAIADYLRIPLYTYERSARPMDRIEEWVHVLDGPLPKIFVPDVEEHYLKAKELGFSTMLTGEMAEFVFDRRGYLAHHLLLHRRIRALRDNFRSQRVSGVPVGNLGRQFLTAFIPQPLSRAIRGYILPTGSAPVPSFLDHERFRRRIANATVPTRRKWLQEQLWAFTGPGLTMEADDILQSLCGIRTRRPWADVDLWEFCLSLPAEMKFAEHGRKRLVRALLRGKVPDLVLDRQDKTGFDDSITARADYDALRRWLKAPEYRVPGVDYATIGDHLDRRDMNAHEYMWAKDLAAVTAFVEST
jgi:asparagine synthetase B (glutamine-hydrolysing)